MISFKFTFATGWCWGDNFRIVSLTIGEWDEGMLTLVDFQVAKFSIQIFLDFSKGW